MGFLPGPRKLFAPIKLADANNCGSPLQLRSFSTTRYNV